ncbi:hypothetical protein P5673_001856 [Acropora cervicornis]|uniref:Uncharacterized protein n=1 Tax=Acropora cervicornis TaxID=6130 RepID=A0AAD9R4Z3_ACRCE|nr:hypothetical protein P5673_001856 [Acropora cervicornis]
MELEPIYDRMTTYPKCRNCLSPNRTFQLQVIKSITLVYFIDSSAVAIIEQDLWNLGADGGVSQHTLRRSSSERLRLAEAGRANDDVSTAAPGLTHDSALASWRSTSSSFLSIILSGTLLCLLVE